jgi:hypothetical protein
MLTPATGRADPRSRAGSAGFRAWASQPGYPVDPPPIAWFVIDEGVLSRPYGGREVMGEQLAKLEELAGQPNVTVQVMPFSAVDHPGLEGPLRIIEFPDKCPAVYNEAWSAGKMTEDKDEVSAAMACFDLIRASAMSPAESAKFIASKRFAE